ncbi:MAG: response regulator [Elusimicrobia bacterium]|nr:response regulator [Elusimicrobiota bacterium]
MNPFQETGRVLVVDDDPQMLRFCRKSLEHPGVEVATVSSPQEALERLRQGPFDLVLSDIRMASPDAGVALAEDIHNRWPETDIIMMTGEPGMDTAIPSIQARSADYLVKPLSSKSLDVAASRVLGMRRLAKELDAERMLRKELEAAYGELRKVERAKEAILSRVSHELMTPVAIARMAADLLASEVSSSPGRAFLGKVSGALTRMQSVVEDLLLFARVRTSGLKPSVSETDLRGLLERAVASLKPLWEARGLSVDTDFRGLEHLVRADPGLLEAAFQRLLLNAIRFNKKAGRIRIVAQSGAEETRVSISDDGPGIPQEEAGRVFDGFYQAADHMTREVGGLGVGLAIVRRVAQAHGGEATVRSKPGEGSTFTFSIPMAATAEKSLLDILEK